MNQAYLNIISVLDEVAQPWMNESGEGGTREVIRRMAEDARKGRGMNIKAHPLDDYHEDIGPVLWWAFPIDEAPYCGSPLDTDWPGYHTHWTRFQVPEHPTKGDS